MKTKIILIILITLPILSYGYNFENGGVRNAALGGTGIASSNDVSTAVWNPAGLSAFQFFQMITDTRPSMIQLDNDNLIENYGYLSFPLATLPGAFAASGGSLNSETYTEGRYGLHYGASIFPEKLTNKLAVGISLFDYYTNFSELDKTKNALDLDLGLSYKINRYAKVGFLAGNILQANMANENNGEDNLPLKLGFGSSVSWKRINLTNDILFKKNQYEELLEIGIGFEYLLAKNLQLRLGMNNQNLTGGFGVIYYSKKWVELDDNRSKLSKMLNQNFLQISLDYAFQYALGSANDGDTFSTGNSLNADFGEHFFGIKINFGEGKDSEERYASLFPSQYGVDLNIDTLLVQKVKIDTIFRTKTIYDTIKVYQNYSDNKTLQSEINKATEEIRKADIVKINEATVYMVSALEHYYSEQYHKAITACENAIYLAPRLSLPYIWLSSIYYRLAEYEDSLYYLDKAKELDPNNEEVIKMMKLLKNK